MLKIKLTRRERRGAFVMILFMMAFTTIRYWVSDPVSSDFQLQVSSSEDYHPDEVTDNLRKESSRKKKPEVHREIGQLKDTLVDINKIGARDLEKVGFSQPDAAFLVKFRNTVGRFNAVESFVSIHRLPQEYKDWLKKNAFISPLELNAATVVELKSFSGVGDKLAARIVSFREKLGGFVDSKQLYEVYGLDSAVVFAMLPVLKTETEVAKLNVNEASLEEMISHPYIDYRMAMEIIKERSVAKIQSLQFLERSYSPELVSKITRYVIYD